MLFDTFMSVQIINHQLLDSLISEAKASPRFRKNYNFHESLDDRCQRMLVALEPCTIMPIHRHKVDEVQILLQGSMKVKIHDDDGNILEEHVLDSQKGQYGIQVSSNIWHTLEVLESGTVIFEVKEGPYIPNEKGNILEINK